MEWNFKIWKKAWSLREGGRDIDAINKKNKKVGFKFVHNHLGTNSRMTEIQAVICNMQLKNLEKNISLRNRNASMIIKVINKFKFINVPLFEKKYFNSYYRLYVKFNKKYSTNKNLTRDKLLKELILNGVPCEEGSCSEIYREKPFKKLNISRKRCASLLSKNSIAFHVHHNLKYEEIKKITIIIEKVLLKLNK